ncbi:hypothetical protein CY0110_18817 [Crocosphaera chwakensis CCY0110]|uniref:Uncharacterized protein n=1 Tax=Crocosphaera chwakensis CCY0110 TaxID=391612 RepID=A3IJ95_9CHRO|nr:hypothetical protein CY0110_18817 [Crocosphaera chwakensis CCY0110]
MGNLKVLKIQEELYFLKLREFSITINPMLLS